MNGRDIWISIIGAVLLAIELAVVFYWPPARVALGGVVSGTILSYLSYFGMMQLFRLVEAEENPGRMMLWMLAKSILVVGLALLLLAVLDMHPIGFVVGISNVAVFARLLVMLLGPPEKTPPA